MSKIGVFALVAVVLLGALMIYTWSIIGKYEEYEKGLTDEYVEAAKALQALDKRYPDPGTTTLEALRALDRDARTEAVVIVGEIGGAMEEAAADYARDMDKPIVAFIAGAAAPPGKRMGHAGAIVLGDKGTFAAKRDALEAAGATVVATPTEIAPALKAMLG